MLGGCPVFEGMRTMAQANTVSGRGYGTASLWGGLEASKKAEEKLGPQKNQKDPKAALERP